MIWLILGCVVLAMIGAGTLISRLAGISEKDRGKKSWIWGVLIIITLIIVPLLLLGIIVKFLHYAELQTVFDSFRR
jgi:Na+-driven multidrug efflux pump